MVALTSAISSVELFEPRSAINRVHVCCQEVRGRVSVLPEVIRRSWRDPAYRATAARFLPSVSGGVPNVGMPVSLRASARPPLTVSVSMLSLLS